MSEENNSLKWKNKESLTEKDPSSLMWEIVSIYKTDKEKAYKLAEYILLNLPFIAAKYLNSNSVLLSNISKPNMASIILDIFLHFDCYECFEQFITLVPEKIILVIGLLKNINNKKEIEFINRMLENENMVEILDILEFFPNEVIRKFKKKLIDIASNEIDQPQYKALKILSALIDEDEDVLNLFVKFISDWDINVRKIVITSLLFVKSKDKIIKNIKDAYLEEDNNELKLILKKMINDVDKNSDG